MAFVFFLFGLTVTLSVTEPSSTRHRLAVTQRIKRCDFLSGSLFNVFWPVEALLVLLFLLDHLACALVNSIHEHSE